jgi:hypothetical protein
MFLADRKKNLPSFDSPLYFFVFFLTAFLEAQILCFIFTVFFFFQTCEKAKFNFLLLKIYQYKKSAKKLTTDNKPKLDLSFNKKFENIQQTCRLLLKKV